MIIYHVSLLTKITIKKLQTSQKISMKNKCKGKWWVRQQCFDQQKVVL